MSRFFRQNAALSYILIGVLCAAGSLMSPRAFSVLEFIENWLADLRLTSMAAPMEPHPDIVLFTITEETLAQFPYRFPLDRGMLADAVKRFNAAGVRAIGMDILFDQPTEAAKDKALAAAIAESRVPVVVGWASADEGLTKTQVEYLDTYLPAAIHAPSNLVKAGGDGTVRWIYPGTDTPKGFRPAFASALAMAPGTTPVRETRDLYFRSGPDGGPVPFRTFPLHLLPNLPPQWFADKIVLIGADLPNEDRHRTPFAALLGNDAGSIPGLVVHAFAIAQMIDGTSFNRQNLIIELVVGVAVAALGVWIAILGAGLTIKLAVAALGLAAIWGTGFGVFYLTDMMLPIFTPSLAFVSAIGLSTAFVAHYERRKKNFAEAMVRRRNESLHKVVENSFDCIVITTSDGEIISTNSSADRVMGWEQQTVIGSSITDHFPDAEELGADFLDISKKIRRASDSEFQPLETDCQRADGSAFTMELVVYTAPVSFDTSGDTAMAGERISYIYSFRDISVRRQTEQAREEARQQAEASNRAKTEFLANMSHELRTPLNAIIGFSELMRTEALGPLGSPQYLEYMNDINGSGQHLIQIINDILDMSKIEAGELSPNEDVFDFVRAADTSTRLVADRAQKGEISLLNNVPDDLPMLCADERMVKQILLNLLSNAVKFTPEGGMVELSGEVNSLGLAFSVADTGCGIPEDKMDIILEPFGQADMTLHRNYEGTGLGLPLVKAMVELHGGVLEILSREGKGTTATVRFPADRIVERPQQLAS